MYTTIAVILLTLVLGQGPMMIQFQQQLGCLGESHCEGPDVLPIPTPNPGPHGPNGPGASAPVTFEVSSVAGGPVQEGPCGPSCIPGAVHPGQGDMNRNHNGG